MDRYQLIKDNQHYYADSNCLLSKEPIPLVGGNLVMTHNKLSTKDYQSENFTPTIISLTNDYQQVYHTTLSNVIKFVVNMNFLCTTNVTDTSEQTIYIKINDNEYKFKQLYQSTNAFNLYKAYDLLTYNEQLDVTISMKGSGTIEWYYNCIMYI